MTAKEAAKLRPGDRVRHVLRGKMGPKVDHQLGVLVVLAVRSWGIGRQGIGGAHVLVAVPQVRVEGDGRPGQLYYLKALPHSGVLKPASLEPMPEDEAEALLVALLLTTEPLRSVNDWLKP